MSVVLVATLVLVSNLVQIETYLYRTGWIVAANADCYIVAHWIKFDSVIHLGIKLNAAHQSVPIYVTSFVRSSSKDTRKTKMSSRLTSQIFGLKSKMVAHNI